MEQGKSSLGKTSRALAASATLQARMQLGQSEAVADKIVGGADNIQDIYPLSPPQEGVLFHCLANLQGDEYVLSSLIKVGSRARLDSLIAALQRVIERHDILRTAVLWEGLPAPLQVVCIQAVLPVQEIAPAPEIDPVEQLKLWMVPERQRFDLSRAPLARLLIARKAHENDSWCALLQLHHLVCDDQSWRFVLAETAACMQGRETDLPRPQPYRTYLDEAMRSSATEKVERFFRSKLGDIDESTAPFGLLDVHANGSEVAESIVELPPSLANRIRQQARGAGVSSARLFHAAWGLVISRTSGREDVVLGTALLTVRQRGERAERMLGMAVNTLPLRLKLNDISVRELIEQTDRELKELLDHQHASLAIARRCSGVPGSAPLFTALINYRHRRPEHVHSVPLQVIAQRGVRTSYPITLAVDDLGDNFVLIVHADRRTDAGRIAGYVQTAVESLTDALERNPLAPVTSLSILPPSERSLLLGQFAGTLGPYRSRECVHQIFEQQVAHTPDAVAVESESGSLTYAELNARANRLARRLRGEGVGPDRLVAICAGRDLEMLVGLLAIWKAGSAYVPLDPNYPEQQLAQIVQDAAPQVLLIQAGYKVPLPVTATTTITLDAGPLAFAEWSDANLTTTVEPAHLAYVIYTSGSTGKPKGVMVEHRNVVAFWQSLETIYARNPSCQRIGVNASFNFDASVQQFVQLLSGRTLVLVSQECRWDSRLLLAFLDQRRIDAIDCTPWQLRTWVDAGLLVPGRHSLRLILIGGEAIEPQMWNDLARCDHIEAYNVYGPTENTVDATAARLHDVPSAPHIGRPMLNRRVYILDRHQHLVPVGVVGELYIGGEGVARGYLNRSNLTAERFMRDPFADRESARMYRTGDLGRWKPDGTIHYLGRNDHQVKIRGFRVELGEIEAQLIQDDRVREAVVTAQPDDTGQKRLVAYVVAQEGHALSAELLRAHLKQTLPDHLIPGAFVVIDRMPVTPGGKLDRGALPKPSPDAYITREYLAPQGEVEEVLAAIWKSLLDLEQVGRQDNFFELGGHSLLIVQMMEQLRRIGLSVDVRAVFGSPTLADLARELSPESEQHTVPPNLIPPGCRVIDPGMLPLVELTTEHLAVIAEQVPGGTANIQDIYPLAPLQEGILFHHLMNDQGGDVYVVPTLLSVATRERVDMLIAGFQWAVNRHDILRTAVLWQQLPRPVQVVYRDAKLQVEQVALDPARNPAEQVKDWMRPERQRLDLARAPLVRLRVAAGPGDEWYVLLSLHHIVEDATSMKEVISEVAAYLSGRATQLPAPLPYRNHVAHALAYARTHDAESYFREKLGDVDQPTAPFGIMDVHGNGTQVEETRRPMDSALAKRVRARARQLGVSSATLFHAAWGLVVARCSGRNDVVFGSVLLGRLTASAGAQQALGMFINTLPFRLQLQNLTARQLVEKAQRELIELLSHEQASLATAQRCSGIEGEAPLFTSLLNFRHTVPNPQMRWAGIEGVTVLATLDRTNYPVTLSVGDVGDGFILAAQTDRRIASELVADYVHTAMHSLLTALESAPDTQAATLQVLSDVERQKIVQRSHGARRPSASCRRVHELFEEQAARAPGSIAVVHGEQSLTYSGLNHRANQLARYLRNLGVGGERPVGIFAERSIDMLVGVLGTLKAGVPYLPLDPNYPPERLEYMLSDAAPQVVLTQTSLRALLPATAAQVIDVRAQWDEIAASDSDVVATPRPSDAELLYVIYTSGSTGQPKGTVMPHDAMLNLLAWHRRALPLSEGERVLQFAALSFDVAFQEVFSTLTAGGTLVLLDEEMRRDVPRLLAYVITQKVARLFVPPLMLQSMAEHAREVDVQGLRLHNVITAGEQLRISPEIVQFCSRMPELRLHNHYGPTETHVVTALTLTGSAATWPTLPSIGQPINNTQIYILDAAQQLVPDGVTGEIYIGGANLARGYLHRPQLTEARFIPDPFSMVPLTRLYRTGDLGRRRPDGAIEYLGRNDDQVKIRGYRVELGEVEAELSRHPQVREAAVIAVDDAAGTKRLVGYVVPRESTDLQIEQLRAQMRGALPDHMVPSALVALEKLPLTPSGKLDRRALPHPGTDAYSRNSYEPPCGAAESTIARVWRELLGVARVGRDDNFFLLGGHSLLVLKALTQINHSLGCSLRVPDMYKSSTVRALAKAILGNASEEEFVDLRRESELSEQIVARSGRVQSGGSVLLTGANGFLGRFLLAQLLRSTDAVIYCLVRAQNKHQASARLRGTLIKWRLWVPAYETRLMVVSGDLSLPRLGLDDLTYQVLAAHISSIYHCATSMNHLETYSMAKAANVEASRELVRLAACKNPKVIQFISTLGVFSPLTTDVPRLVCEDTSIDHERHPSSRGYVASKWVGEKIFMNAQERGIPCNIFRVGLAWADAEHGRYDELQRGYRLIKSCLLSGFGIANYRFEMPPTPVDYVARAIVALALKHENGGGVFHITSTDHPAVGLFEFYNENAGTSLQLLHYYEWLQEMKRLHGEGRSLPVLPLIASAFSMDEEAFQVYQRRVRTIVQFDSLKTRHELETTAGIEVPVVEDDLLLACLQCMLANDPELRSFAGGTSNEERRNVPTKGERWKCTQNSPAA